MAVSGITLGAVQTIIAVAVPVIGAFITLAVWYHHRINALEDNKEQKVGAGMMFGSPDDPLAISLAKELRDVKKTQKENEEDVRELKNELDDMQNKLDNISNAIEDLKD
jgi:gas vesicle protein